MQKKKLKKEKQKYLTIRKKPNFILEYYNNIINI